MDNGISLSNMVAALRSELEAAQIEAKGKSLCFSVEGIDLELQIASEKSDKAVFGVKFWVVNSSADFTDKNVVTQKLHLKLKVTDQKGEPGKPAVPLSIAGEVSD